MRNKTNGKILTTVLVILVIVGLLVCFTLFFSFNDKEYIITVTDKERVVTVDNDDGDVSSKYLIFGDNEAGETLVFQNVDDWLRGKYNSSTIQGSLKEGHTYKIIVVGYRVPFLSMYENIISFEELKGSE